MRTPRGSTSWPGGWRLPWHSPCWWGSSAESPAGAGGPASGAAAGFALVAMPRVFAHAHLAALDTFLSLFWTLALLAGNRALRAQASRRRDGRGRGGLVTCPLDQDPCLVPVADPRGRRVWLLPPRRALAAMAVWAVVGISLFWVGWPWLWYSPLARLQGYFGTGVDRSTILVQYFGRVFADRDVPWHYPWFYFAVTVPVGLHALGILGVVQGWKNRRPTRCRCFWLERSWFSW